MNTLEDLSGFEARLLGELTSRVTPPAAQAPAKMGLPYGLRPRLVVGLLAAMLVVAVPSILAPTRTSAYAVTQLPDGRVHVTIASDFDQSKRLERALASVGVEVDVVRLTAHPRLVGAIEFVPLGPGGVAAAGARGLEVGKGEFWIDPDQFRGSVELLVYVSTKPGQHWQAAPSIFHPDEPLGGLPCAMDGALDTATLERYAAQVGITDIEWQLQTVAPGAEGYLPRPTSKRPNGDVIAASMSSSDTLSVSVSPPGAAPEGLTYRPSMDLGLHTGERVVCTPDLAARWR